MAGLPSSSFMEARRRKPVGLSLRDGLPGPRSTPRGFTLTELLVAIGIVLVLAGLLSAAVAGARGSSRKNPTVSAIERLDNILNAQFRRYESRSISSAGKPAGMTFSAYRAWKIRREQITGDMVDRWTDVAYMAANPAQFTSAAQRAYIATWNAAVAADKTPTTAYAGGECLFMTIMQGGFADCLDCESLKQFKKGDKDGDGMFEFWDGWNNPIGYILWPPAYEIPGKGALFFTGSRSLDDPFSVTARVRPSLGMRPLIYSAGPDGEYGLERNGDASTLNAGTNPVGRDCGNPLADPSSKSGGPTTDAGAKRNDNITNFDRESAS